MCEIIFFSYLRPRHAVLSEENFVDSNLCVTQCGNFLKGTCHFPYTALAKGTFPHVRLWCGQNHAPQTGVNGRTNLSVTGAFHRLSRAAIGPRLGVVSATPWYGHTYVPWRGPKGFLVFPKRQLNTALEHQHAHLSHRREKPLSPVHSQHNPTHPPLIDSFLTITVIGRKLSISNESAGLCGSSWISLTHLCQHRPRIAEMSI